MRTLFLLLLLANITLFGYIELDSVSSGEGVRLRQQVQPEKIRLLTPQQVAGLGPEKSAAVAETCVEWGPFNDAERARVLADLDAIDVGRLVTPKRAETTIGYWVYIAPFPTRAAADRRVSELKEQGLRDAFVLDTGGQRFAVSLGVFRTEEGANTHLGNLIRRGVPDAKVGPRQQALPLTSIQIRDLPGPALARIRELQSGYPGAELRIVACDKGP